MALTLLRHPFAVEAFFNYSLVLAYALPVDTLRKRLPPYLEVDSYEDRLGFIAAAFVDTTKLRPRGFPEFIGRNFILVGYRIFVRYRDKRGRRLRGLYILRSETNSLQMKFLGNLFTSYNYHCMPIYFLVCDDTIEVSAPNGLCVKASLTQSGDMPLPVGSPFPSWKEARRYAGPLPFTFSFHRSRSEMTIVEGVREDWQPLPAQVLESQIPTIAELGFPDAQLANAFFVRDIPYFWRAAVIEHLPHKKKGDAV